MRSLLAISLIIVLTSCGNKNEQVAIVEEINNQIETNLVPLIQFDDEENVRTTLDKRMREFNIQGVSIAVAKEKKIIYSNTIGYASIENKTALTNQTMFLTGSISKLITAGYILKLVEKEMVKLDEPINNYLNQWKIPENQFSSLEKVTIRSLLEHTSGLEVRAGRLIKESDSLPTALDLLNEISPELINIPGEKYAYSDNNFLVLQQLITEMDGSFIQSLQEGLLTPLEMEHSSFNAQDHLSNSEVATGYDDDGERVESTKYADLASEGLWSAPSDLLKYLTELQSSYQTKADGFYNKKTIQQLQFDKGSGNRLGISNDKYTFGSMGNANGYSSKVLAWKDFPYSIAICTNGPGEALVDEIIYAIANALKLPTEIKPTIYNVALLKIEQLEKYKGYYQPLTNNPLGNLRIQIEDKKITLFFEDSPTKTIARPINDSTFVDKDGYYHRFTIKDNEVLKFIGWGFLEYEKQREKSN